MVAPTFAQGLGADPETTKLFEWGTNGGFFILAMYWMRQDAKDAMARLERAYSKQQPEA